MSCIRVDHGPQYIRRLARIPSLAFVLVFIWSTLYNFRLGLFPRSNTLHQYSMSCSLHISTSTFFRPFLNFIYVSLSVAFISSTPTCITIIIGILLEGIETKRENLITFKCFLGNQDLRSRLNEEEKVFVSCKIVKMGYHVLKCLMLDASVFHGAFAGCVFAAGG